MKNRITFSNVIGVLLENKKKTYADRKICGTVFNMVCKDKKQCNCEDVEQLQSSYKAERGKNHETVS